jgi:hypothetical protein
MTFLKGKKTYIVALVVAGLAAAQVLGITIPFYVYTLLSAAGLGSLRVAISNLGE